MLGITVACLFVLALLLSTFGWLRSTGRFGRARIGGPPLVVAGLVEAAGALALIAVDDQGAPTGVLVLIASAAVAAGAGIVVFARRRRQPPAVATGQRPSRN